MALEVVAEAVALVLAPQFVELSPALVIFVAVSVSLSGAHLRPPFGSTLATTGRASGITARALESRLTIAGADSRATVASRESELRARPPGG